MVLSLQTTGDSAAVFDKEKFKLYGYRLLSVHFMGYVKPDGKSDAKTGETFDKIVNQMKDWYGHIDEMYSGSLTLATRYGEQIENFINPGDVISVFGVQFYVDGVTHNWSYGQGGETNLTISRGGKYVNGEFNRISDISNNMTLLEKGIS